MEWIPLWIYLFGGVVAVVIFLRTGFQSPGLVSAFIGKDDEAGEKFLGYMLVGLVSLLVFMVWPVIVVGFSLYKVARIGLPKKNA